MNKVFFSFVSLVLFFITFAAQAIEPKMIEARMVEVQPNGSEKVIATTQNNVWIPNKEVTLLAQTSELSYIKECSVKERFFFSPKVDSYSEKFNVGLTVYVKPKPVSFTPSSTYLYVVDYKELFDMKTFKSDFDCDIQLPTVDTKLFSGTLSKVAPVVRHSLSKNVFVEMKLL